MAKDKNDSDAAHGRPDFTSDAVARALGAGDKDGRKRSAALFAGLVADDDDPDRIRLYQEYGLRTFVSIARADVIFRERTKNQAGTEVSLVWVDRDADVKICEISSETVQADLLAQAIVAGESGDFPPLAAMSGAAGGVATTPLTPTIPILTALICTKVFCTNFTCLCTSRHSLTCSLFCPLPKTFWLCPRP